MTIKTPDLTTLDISLNLRQLILFKTKWQMVVLTLVICATLLWFEISVAKRVKLIESAWLEFNLEASRAGKVLNEISINFGYGGLIHNFKNYILRKDPSFVPKIKKNFSSLLFSVNKYSALNITDEEKKSLLRLKHIINLYQLKFKSTQSFIAQGKTSQQIDKSVQVNDQPAFDAISYLKSRASLRYKENENNTTNQLENALFFQKLGSHVLIPLLLLIGILFINFLRKLEFANKLLMKSQNQLQNIFESSPDAILIINNSGGIKQVNNKVVDLFGYSADELIGKPMEMLMPERFRKNHVMIRNSSFSKKNDRAMAGEQDFFALKKNGKEIAIDIGLSFMGEAENKQAIVTLRDITDRKQAEDTLNRFKTTLDMTTDCVFIFEPETLAFTYVNKGAMNHVGRSFDEIMGMTPVDIKMGNSNDEESFRQIIEPLMQGSKNFLTLEAMNEHKSGCQIPVELSLQYIAPVGEAPRFVAMVRDISERKKAEAELELADSVFNHTDEAIIVADANKKVLRINQAFTVISGFSEKETLGKRPDKLFSSGEYDDKFYQDILGSLNEKGMWEGEIINCRKSGELFPCWHNMSVVKDKHGKIIQYISIFSDITEKKHAEEYIRHLAQYDPLTNLPNRALFHDRMQHATSIANRSKNKVALMFIDLDHFKNINDTLGHQEGDRLLQIIAERLSGCVRSQDTVARLGGDEFTVILENLKHAENAAIVAEKILKSLTDPIVIGTHEIISGASIGISIFPEDGNNTEAIIKNADIAMYKAKQEGRNQYQFYSIELSQYADLKFHMEKNLRHALENNELEVFYQPQVNLESGMISGAEALIRWNNPEKGLMSPADFLPFAEESGLIEPIGDWVLEIACTQAKAWQDQGLTKMRISVNVAGYQITHGHIIESTKAALKKSGLSAKYLELEITEDFFMDYLDKGVETLKALKDIGVSLAIDDFGTGYSSLSYLKQLPVDRLKIDRSFIIDILKDKDNDAIISTIITMAKNLGLSVTAEGAECDKQIQFLTKACCEEVQGYYFSRPVPAADFSKLLTSSFEL